MFKHFKLNRLIRTYYNITAGVFKMLKIQQ